MRLLVKKIIGVITKKETLGLEEIYFKGEVLLKGTRLTHSLRRYISLKGRETSWIKKKS